MKGLFTGFMNFLHGIFTQGRPESASRFLMFLHAGAAIAWVTHFVVHWHALPDFSGLTMFVATPYAINKAPDIAGAIRGGVAQVQGQ